jgi:hypothetical protein
MPGTVAHGVHLAVEIGASSTAAVVHASGRRTPLLLDGMVRMPSGVFVDPETGLLHPGAAGWSAAVKRPDRYVADPLGSLGAPPSSPGGADPVDLVAAVLRHVAAHTAARPDGLTLCIPIRFGPRRHQLVYEAASRAGLPPPRLVTVAAAAAAHLEAVAGPVDDRACLLVCHIDAGSCALVVLQHADGGYRELAAATAGDTQPVLAALVDRAAAAAGGDLAERLRRSGTEDDRRLRWQVEGHVRAAVHAIVGAQARAAVLLPEPYPPVVLDREDLAAAVKTLLDPLPAAVADLLAAADVDTAQLGRVAISGEFAGLPDLAGTVHAATGRQPIVLDAAPHALADGALQIGGPPVVPATAAGTRLPRTRLRAGDLVGLFVLAACSVALLVQAVANAWTQNLDAVTITDVYIATEQITAAAAYACLAALAVAHLAPTVWLSGTQPDPATEPTTGTLIRNAYLSAAGVGLAVAVLQGLAAGLPFERSYLPQSLAAAVPAAIGTLLIAVTAPRIPTAGLPAWQARTRPPIAWPALAAIGMLLMQAGLTGGFPTNLIGLHGLVGSVGAGCIGVATVLTLTRHRLIATFAAPVLGLACAAVYSLAAAPVLTIGYLCALGWWLLGLTFHTLRAAFPNVGASLRRLVDGGGSSG